MRFVAFLFLLLVTLVSSRDGVAEEKPPKLELSAAEKAILELTNQARAAEKLPPLTPNAALFQAARAHTNNMAKQRKLDHVLYEKRVKDRVKAAGYEYKEIGENIAVAEGATAEMIVEGWLKSPHHRENLLRATYTEIGLGVVKNADGETYYTQVFGLPRKP